MSYSGVNDITNNIPVTTVRIQYCIYIERRRSNTTNQSVTYLKIQQLPVTCYNIYLTKCDKTRVVYHGVTSSFFGIGILLVSDLLDFRYFSRYRSPLYCILPPFPPPFFPKGGWSSQKGGHCPPFEEKGGTAPFSIPKCTDRVFLRYGIGNTGEIPTEYRPKIPNWYTTLR